MNNTISELKNTVEGIKNRLNEAEYWISELEDKVEKKTKHPEWARNGEETQKEWRDVNETAGQNIISVIILSKY